MLERGDGKIEPAVVVVIAPVDSHAAVDVPAAIVGRARSATYAVESAAVILEQIAGHLIVGQGYALMPRAIEVRAGDSERFSSGAVDSPSLRNVAESSASLVVV